MVDNLEEVRERLRATLLTLAHLCYAPPHKARKIAEALTVDNLRYASALTEEGLEDYAKHLFREAGYKEFQK